MYKYIESQKKLIESMRQHLKSKTKSFPELMQNWKLKVQKKMISLVYTCKEIHAKTHPRKTVEQQR